jgi:membrane-bound metal-dependent hydrolase YbcI (DUF457 family)
MDILSHGLSGVAAATVVSAFTQTSWKQKLLIGGVGLLGGVLPDIDVISAWSGFDATFGKWFNLQQPGKEIFWSTHWYSHHVFTHSLLAAVLFTLLGLGLFKTIYRYKVLLSTMMPYAIAFFAGYLLHLFEDMITPGGSWKGIAFFWPSSQFVGGWGKTYWWNNYDLFLIISGTIVLNTIVLLFRYKTRLLTLLGFGVALLLFIIQVERRQKDFKEQFALGKNHEEASLAIQHQYLGSTTYQFMVQLDELIPVAF